MRGTKYTLKNNTTSSQFFDYKTLSNSMWNYQVSLNPNQVKTIWTESGTLNLYNNNSITIEEQSSFPPVHSPILPSPSQTPTPTPTPTGTPTPTPTPTGTPTV